MGVDQVAPAPEEDLQVVDASKPSAAWTEEDGYPTRLSRAQTRNVEETRRLFNFADPEQIKNEVRKNVFSDVPPYSVFDFYYETGCFQWIAKHSVFENMTLAVISLNAVYIAIDTDWNKPRPLESQASNDLQQSHLGFQIMEHFFCAYFTAEWIVRFAAFQNKCNCARDGWFVFDTLLVFMMVVETWAMPIASLLSEGGDKGSPLGNTAVLRLFRLLRLSRLMRMLRSFSELMILVRGMVQAMTSVFYVMCLLVIITYIFAIAFTQLSVGTECGEKYFANVAKAMYTLLIHATFMDDMAAWTDDLRVEYWPLLALALVFVCLASLTLMNMLVGVLCEVVSAVAAAEKEEMHAEKMAKRMMGAFKDLDENGDEQISYAEFSKLMAKPDAIACLKEQDVNPLQVVDLADMFFFEDGNPKKLTFAEFMGILMDLREVNQARVKDIWNLGSQIKAQRGKDQKLLDMRFEEVREQIERLDAKIDKHSAKLSEQMQKILFELQRTNPLKKVNIDTGHLAHTLPGTLKKATIRSVQSQKEIR